MPIVILALRIIGVALGVTMIGLGVPLFFMPIPLGLIFFVFGVVLLLASSTQFAAWVRARRRRHTKFDARMCSIENVLPRMMRGILVGTRP